ncbi:Glyceraldehyde 3-phosphate dehydrogenase, partial [human gut metagenome]
RDRMNNEIQIAEREGDYEKAGRLKYSELPALEKQLAQEEDKVGESDLSLVHEKVSEEEIARIISRWTSEKGHLRRSRAGACNIVPNSTGAAKAIGLVIPELNGKLIGSAQRVPTPTGSTTILVAVVKGAVTKEEINAAMKAASTESFGYNTDEIVSSDIVGSTYGSIFDATQTMVAPMEFCIHHTRSLHRRMHGKLGQSDVHAGHRYMCRGNITESGTTCDIRTVGIGLVRHLCPFTVILLFCS